MAKYYNNFSASDLTLEDFEELVFELDDFQKVAVWNEHCDMNNSTDDYIYTKDEFLESIRNMEPEAILELGRDLGGDVDSYYYKLDGYGDWNGSDDPDDFIEVSEIWHRHAHLIDSLVDVDGFIEDHRESYEELFDDEEE